MTHDQRLGTVVSRVCSLLQEGTGGFIDHQEHDFAFDYTDRKEESRSWDF